MRYREAKILIVALASLVSLTFPAWGQESVVDNTLELFTGLNCPPPPRFQAETNPGNKIAIAQLTFSGATQLPLSEQDRIAAEIKERTHGESLEDVLNEAVERAREGWQDRGYFKVEAGGDAKTLTGNPVSQRIAIDIYVDEGEQYRLGGITFKNNKAIRNQQTLRGLFPIGDGEIFSRDRIAKGLENLRKAYGEFGYINFTAVPNTKLDYEQKLAYLDMDVDEGKQFYVSSFDIIGVDEASRQELLREFPIGQTYNARLFELFVDKHASILGLASDDPAHVIMRLNDRAGTVGIVLDTQRCATK